MARVLSPPHLLRRLTRPRKPSCWLRGVGPVGWCRGRVVRPPPPCVSPPVRRLPSPVRVVSACLLLLSAAPPLGLRLPLLALECFSSPPAFSFPLLCPPSSPVSTLASHFLQKAKASWKGGREQCRIDRFYQRKNHPRKNTNTTAKRNARLEHHVTSA